MLSRTLRHGSNAGSWKATPIWWSSRDADGSRPWMRTVPDVGSSRPASIRRTVDLPHPDGPSSAVSVPIAAV